MSSKTTPAKNAAISVSDSIDKLAMSKSSPSTNTRSSQSALPKSSSHEVTGALVPLPVSGPSSARKSRRKAAKIQISFTGFKEGTDFDMKLKKVCFHSFKELIAAIKKLPDVAVISGPAEGIPVFDVGFDKRITHIIQPQACRTLKSFAASLSLSWLIIDPKALVC